MEPNLTFLGIVIRLIAGMVWAIAGWLTAQFAFYMIGMLTITIALTGYDPLIQIMQRRKEKQKAS